MTLWNITLAHDTDQDLMATFDPSTLLDVVENSGPFGRVVHARDWSSRISPVNKTDRHMLGLSNPRNDVLRLEVALSIPGEDEPFDEFARDCMDDDFDVDLDLLMDRVAIQLGFSATDKWGYALYPVS